MKEPFYTYEEFPENMSGEEGMKIIYGQDERGISCPPDVVYAVKDGVELHLRVMIPSVLDANRRYPTVVSYPRVRLAAAET